MYTTIKRKLLCCCRYWKLHFLTIKSSSIFISLRIHNECPFATLINNKNEFLSSYAIELNGNSKNAIKSNGSVCANHKPLDDSNKNKFIVCEFIGQYR